MRQRTKIPIPEPGPSEFKNFDRLVGILIAKKPPAKQAEKPERRAKAQKTAR